jgi:hypothetical protein
VLPNWYISARGSWFHGDVSADYIVGFSVPSERVNGTSDKYYAGAAVVGHGGAEPDYQCKSNILLAGSRRQRVQSAVRVRRTFEAIFGQSRRSLFYTHVGKMKARYVRLIFIIRTKLASAPCEQEHRQHE